MFSHDHLHTLRVAEVEKAASFFPPGARVLEVGAGTGKQALELSRRGFHVTAIEIPDSSYAAHRVFPVVDYDGATIPLPDASVDVVFSSNVLEHVRDLPRLHRETRRVLAPGGRLVHVLPTHAWRTWETLAAYPDAVVFLASQLPQLVPRALPRGDELRRLGRAWYATAHGVGRRCLPHRHGERGNVVSEVWLFHPSWWRRHFGENGFTLLHDEPMGLFYTGNMLLGARLSLEKRERLACTLGSACHLYELAPGS